MYFAQQKPNLLVCRFIIFLLLPSRRTFGAPRKKDINRCSFSSPACLMRTFAAERKFGEVFSAPKWNSLWKLFLRAHSVFQEILGFRRLRKLFNHSPDFFSFAFPFLSLPWISINFNVISFFSDVSVQVLRPSRVCRFRVFLILLARPYCALIVPHREYEMICSLKWKNLKPQKLLRFHCWPKWCGVKSRECLNKASGFMKMFTPIMKSGWKTFSAIKLGSLWSN